MKGKRLARVWAVLALLASLGIGVGGASSAGATSAMDELGAEAALGTVFTYQGLLRDGSGPVNATCDLQFKLWDAPSGGSQVSWTWLLEDVVLVDGLFTARLDFGAEAFRGQARYLEVAASCPVGSAFVPLPRQELTASPYALWALGAPWTGLTGVPADLADGDQDTTYGAGTGLSLVGGQFSVNFAGTGSAGTASRSDHNHDAAYVNEGQANSVSTGMVQNSTLLLEDLNQNGCSTGQIIKWSGSAWACAADATGATSFWSLTGNAGTTPGTNYLGTSDNTALEIRVNGARALRLEPNAISPNVVGGYSGNVAWTDVYGASIGGGGTAAAVNGVYDLYGTVGGGVDNAAYGEMSTVSGGGHNAASHKATVGGGEYNHAEGEYSVVAGGDANHAGGSLSVIGGGESISVTGYAATVAGGAQITVTANYGAVGGGLYNLADEYASTVGGGAYNTASGAWSVVGGGSSNTASGQEATVAGGYDHTATGAFAAIGGGGYNTANGQAATVGGGWTNTAGEYDATVGGGYDNTASGGRTTVGGGAGNLASDYYGTVAGGNNNQAGDNAGSTDDRPFATVGGGRDNIASGTSSVVAGGDTNTASGEYATVGGGSANQASSSAATVGGGGENEASGPGDTVGGGNYNQAIADSATIGGGLDNTAYAQYATVGGGTVNLASGWSATVGGGEYNTASGSDATVGGGASNNAGAQAAVGGGFRNLASGESSVVGGGEDNTAAGQAATVGGGYPNVAHAASSTVGGGWFNTASGNAATVPGGAENQATGGYSFAAGAQAHATHDGSFVWSSATATDSWGTQTFTVRSHGGARFYTAGGTGTGVQLGAGGTSWGSISDRNAKEAFAPVDTAQLLEVLASMPVQTWNLKSQAPEMRHIGPVAQDFNGSFAYLFGEVESPIHINNMDAVGISLAASQGLYELSQEQAVEIAGLQAENAALREQLGDLESRLAALEAGQSSGRSAARLPSGWLLLGGSVLVAGVVVVRRARGGGR